MELLPHLLSTPVTLGNFGLRRMAAHLLLEVAAGGAPVSRDELHARMRRFVELLVLRPDGYLVKPTTGVAVQKAGQVVLAEDGTLRAGRFEVGPFYAIDGGRLFAVDERLEVPGGARPMGLYEPDDNAGLAVAEGAVLAVVDMVEGLYTAVAPALSATYVLHMANTGAQGVGGGGGWPPVGGPGQWVEDTSSMSEQARAYQAQVTGAPKGWCYRVCRDGRCVDYDGFDPKTSTLLEAKAREYEKWFDTDLQPKWGYEGLEGMVLQARRQSGLAGGLRLRWHVAEPRMVAILQRAFREARITGIEVVYTQPLPFLP
jgi:hypothetical protein